MCLHFANENFLHCKYLWSEKLIDLSTNLFRILYTYTYWWSSSSYGVWSCNASFASKRKYSYCFSWGPHAGMHIKTLLKLVYVISHFFFQSLNFFDFKTVLLFFFFISLVQKSILSLHNKKIYILHCWKDYMIYTLKIFPVKYYFVKTIDPMKLLLSIHLSFSMIII